MAIDKSNTPPWMKGVLIFLAVIFVFGFCSIAANPFTLFSSQGGQGGTTDPLDAINQQHQANVGALTGQLQSDPESYTILVALGNTYFDWAAAVQQASQTSTSAVGADAPLWTSAKDAYRRAVAVRNDESPVLVDYAITLFYTGDTNQAVKIAEGVKKSDPDFPPAWFNLGIFYGALGQKDKAISSLEQYLKLDPNGQQGNPDYAKQQLESLKSGAATATP